MNNFSHSFPGYQISEKLYEGLRTIVYRAKSTENNQPVVIKIMRSEFPSFRELVQFRNQYTIAKNLDLPGIVHPYSLNIYHHGFAVIMEDFGGIALQEYMNLKPLELSDFFPIALQITDVLQCLYQNRVIHKDIKPSNLLINPHTKQIKLIDFSIASLLPKETQQLQNPNVLEGTLAYLSPEQTGRMNRGIDYRSDFYALGVTFYQLLTGKLPFPNTDPMELIHAHIAGYPAQAHEINPQIPIILSELINKLMAKNAEDRYQTALGLKHDLEQCWQNWQTTNTIEAFELGCQDICDRFIIPEKLYGRQAEVQTLLKAFERISARAEPQDSETAFPQKGQAEMILVAGYSGIGKTSVVNEVHKPIVEQRGYFIAGKFDQFQRNIPFSALVLALRDLMKQLLSETEQQLHQWKIKILDTLGENAAVIIDVIPELELILGQQPPAPQLSGSAAENRFNLLFQKFIRLFATPEHPLVIFIDDLQWVDSASLKLIKSLMSQTETRHLLLIGAYRDNEVDSTHPLMLTLADLQKHQVVINTITLGSLRLYHELNPLVADTLNCSREQSLLLSQIIYKKTKGNPFFTIQFLKALYEEGLITFNHTLVQNQEKQKKIFGGWQCDLAKIKSLALTEDVVKFVASRLKKLNTATQEVLKKAACIGNQFDLETLAIVQEKSLTETATDLWVALQEGLIIPLTEVYKFYTAEQTTTARPMQAVIPSVTYKFLHDRIQQAAYSLIPDTQKQETHLKIGELLLEKIPEAEQQDKLFDIVNQLNIGTDLIQDKIQHHQLAQLNLRAGQKAKASTAYKAAIDYVSQGLKLLQSNGWQTQYQLTLNLLIESAELNYLISDFSAALNNIDQIITHSHHLLDQCEAYEIKIKVYIAQLQTKEAINLTLYVLELLDMHLESELSQEIIVEDLINLPAMNNPSKLAAMQILMTVIPAAYVVQPQLLLPIIVTMIQLSIRYGNSPISAFAYVFYGVLLCGSIGDIDLGYRFGELSLKVLDQFEDVGLKCKVYHLFGAMVKPWKKSISQANQIILDSIPMGLDTGDIEYASYSMTDYCNYKFLMGDPLDSVVQTYDQYLDLTKSLKQTELSNTYIDIWSQISRCLRGDKSDYLSMTIKGLSEAEIMQWLEESDQIVSIFATYFGQSLLYYLFHQYEQSVNTFEKAQILLGYSVGKIYATKHNFYYSLALLSLAHQTTSDARQSYLQQVVTNQEQLKQWADYAPMNFLHQYYLVEAEQNRVLNQPMKAMERYEQSIALAQENKYLHEEALAYELAAQFYLNWGKETIAKAYLTQAYYGYARWGAKAKLEDLETRYPVLLQPILNQTNHLTISSTLTGTVSLTQIESSILLDFNSIMKAAQAISSEMELEKLLETLMQVTLENTGAEKGVLLLLNNEQWTIEAQAQRNSETRHGIQVQSLQAIPLAAYSDLPHGMIHYGARTRKTLVLDQVVEHHQFKTEPYILEYQPQSILLTPIISRNHLVGLLYLENRLTSGVFSQEQVKVINILTTQAAISLENAQLYNHLASAHEQLETYSHNLEQKVQQRTQELSEKNQELSQTLKQLQKTQAHLIHTEKLSSLGQMVAGIAHEINNPVGFISGNLYPAQDYIQDLLKLITTYQQEYPEITPTLQAVLDEIDLEFLQEDLYKVLGSIKEGSQRITKIVQALRNFSRLDEAEFKAINIHEGLESTLVLLQNRLKATTERPEIQITRHYGSLPLMNCYAAQLNQVFFNLINNAIDALEATSKHYLNCDFQPEIIIHTELTAIDHLTIRIIDNGCGIPEQVQQKMFDPFFTTKPVGSGTGLGLPIAHSIIVEQHQGELKCRSLPKEMTEFIIELPLLTR